MQSVLTICIKTTGNYFLLLLAIKNLNILNYFIKRLCNETVPLHTIIEAPNILELKSNIFLSIN